LAMAIMAMTPATSFPHRLATPPLSSEDLAPVMEFPPRYLRNALQATLESEARCRQPRCLGQARHSLPFARAARRWMQATVGCGDATRLRRRAKPGLFDRYLLLNRANVGHPASGTRRRFDPARVWRLLRGFLLPERDHSRDFPFVPHLVHLRLE